MKEPILVIMAAGMGSRYGGLKQIDPIDDEGHIIIDFSLYDAYRAGFRRAVFIIKPEMEKEFREVIGNRMEEIMDISYAFQRLDALPDGYAVPEGRVKPWGTGHAILSCDGLIDAPFAVINSDDYYGREAFKLIYDFLSNVNDNEKYQYSMVGYKLGNTLTDFGSVARGICEVNEDNMLLSVTEHTRIEKHGGRAEFTEDGGESWTELPMEQTVSMNLWGFTPKMIEELKIRFPEFLESSLKTNPLKCEYFLPSVVSELINEDKAEVKVLRSADKWYGVTYKEDKKTVVNAIASMKARGDYPEKLWE